MARRRRRDPKKEEFWRGMVQGQAKSGLSVRNWCGQHDLRESLFYWWRKRLARRDSEARPAAFVPVRVTTGPSASEACDVRRIEIVLQHERRVCVIGPVDRQALTDVLAVMMSADFTALGAAAC